MGRVVNKSFNRVRKDIGKKANKILIFLENHTEDIGLPGYETSLWTSKQNKAYEKLATLCYDFIDEVDNLDEIEVPKYKS